MVPSWIFKYNLWATMSGTEVKVLGMIAKRANNVTKVCMPTHETIAKESGVSKKSISQITHNLFIKDIIKKWRHGNRMHYKLNFEPSEQLTESGVSWDTSGMVRKKSASYPRNAGTGKFIPKNTATPIPKKSVTDIPKNMATA